MIQVVESDAISAYRAFRSADETFDRLGYREVAKAVGVELVNLSKAPSWEVQVPTFPEPVRIPALFFEDFFFISVANVKLHPYERFTGIMKNNYGLLPQADRTALHMRLPEILFTIYELCRTDLAILDGRIGLEGHGPIIGRPKRWNRVIVGNDALAVDVAACRLIGLNPARVPHLRHACRRLGLRAADLSVTGDQTVEPFVQDDPATPSLIIAKFALRRMLARLEQGLMRATNWAFECRRDPVAFCARIARRAFSRG
jgi:uncharacterized protein (DUF362 family)